MAGSKVLQVLVGCALGVGMVSLPSSVGAGGYCLQNYCHVWPDFPNLGGGGNVGGGGGWGGSDNTGRDQEQQQHAQYCTDFRAEFSTADCNFDHPPQLIPNGCGSGTVDVPDFLVSTTMALPALALGTIFTGACNAHDICYGTQPQNTSQPRVKEDCDNHLYDDMVAAGNSSIPDALKPVLMPSVMLQAAAYSKGLQFEEITAFASGPAFIQAQKEAVCRDAADYFNESCR